MMLFFPSFLSFFLFLTMWYVHALQVRASENRGVTHTLENVGFSHCLRVTRVRIPRRTSAMNAVALDRHLTGKNKAGSINSSVDPSAPGTWWSASSALAGEQRSDLFLLSVCLAFSFETTLSSSSFDVFAEWWVTLLMCQTSPHIGFSVAVGASAVRQVVWEAVPTTLTYTVVFLSCFSYYDWVILVSTFKHCIPASFLPWLGAFVSSPTLSFHSR